MDVLIKCFFNYLLGEENMEFTKIFQDQSLCGHQLMQMPDKIWNFSQGQLSLFPVPGKKTVLKNYMIAKRVSYSIQTPDTQKTLIRTELFTDRYLCNGVEYIGRRLFGTCAAAISFATLIPIGFSAKCIHWNVRSVKIYLLSTAQVKKVCKIWTDHTLFGHALTSAPAKCYHFATAPLKWHLRSDGTDRRAYIMRGGLEGYVIQQSEYEFFPFELFEFPYRRIMGGGCNPDYRSYFSSWVSS
jgi:hypothetical protein